MQRLQLNPEESISRKEYLKRKKKQAKKIKEVNKSRVVIAVCMILLGIYVVVQFLIYTKANSYKYVEGENVSKQDVYDIYYVTDGYTYDPVYSLNSVKSNGFEDLVIYQDVGITDIYSTSKYIYGIKADSLYRVDKSTHELELIVEKNVNKITGFNDEIYFTSGNNNKLNALNEETKKVTDLGIDNIVEIVVDKDYLFLVQDKKTKKILVRIDKNGKNKKELVNKEDVSYIIEDLNNIYYVNKGDDNKIYNITKDGKNNQKLADIVSTSDKGDVREIDGSKYMVVNMGYLYYINTKDNNSLWKLNLATKENSVEISVPIEILQNAQGTLFYKMKNEMGVYLYNVETKFMSQVTKRKVKEFFVSDKVAEEKIEYKNNMVKN